MDVLMELFLGIVGFGFTVLTVGFKLILALVAGIMASFKGRSFFFWAIVVFFFPWVILIEAFMPKKYPKLSKYMAEKEEFKGKNPVVSSIMALSAIVAKSDGNVTEKEISTIKQFLTANFGVARESLNDYSGAFNYGKAHPEEYKEFTKTIATYFRRKDQIVALAYLFVSIAVSDDEISQAEDNNIKKILLEFGISDYEYASIKNSFINGGQSYGRRSSGQSEVDRAKKAYESLGIPESSDMGEIKSAYRKLMKEFHPDKIAAKGMPPEYEEFAKKKSVEINDAYEYLKGIKG